MFWSWVASFFLGILCTIVILFAIAGFGMFQNHIMTREFEKENGTFASFALFIISFGIFFACTTYIAHYVFFRAPAMPEGNCVGVCNLPSPPPITDVPDAAVDAGE